jgi:hypothetical protein
MTSKVGQYGHERASKVRAQVAPSEGASQVDIGEITRIIEIERIEEIVPVRDPHPTPPLDPDAVPA